MRVAAVVAVGQLGVGLAPGDQGGVAFVQDFAAAGGDDLDGDAIALADEAPGAGRRPVDEQQAGEAGQAEGGPTEAGSQG